MYLFWLLASFGKCSYNLGGVFKGVLPLYKVWSDYSKRPAIALAPYLLVALLYQQRKLENYLIFGDIKDKAKREIKDFSDGTAFLSNMIKTKTFLSRFRSRMQSGVSANSAPGELNNTTGNLLNPSRRKILPSTKDWDSVSNSERSYEPHNNTSNFTNVTNLTAMATINNNDDNNTLQPGQNETRIGLTASACNVMNRVVPENITDMNPLKQSASGAVSIPVTEGEDNAMASRRKYQENVAFKIKEQNSSLRIISDVGLGLMLLPDFSEIVINTGIWNLWVGWINLD